MSVADDRDAIRTSFTLLPTPGRARHCGALSDVYAVDAATTAARAPVRVTPSSGYFDAAVGSKPRRTC